MSKIIAFLALALEMLLLFLPPVPSSYPEILFAPLGKRREPSFYVLLNAYVLVPPVMG